MSYFNFPKQYPLRVETFEKFPNQRFSDKNYLENLLDSVFKYPLKNLSITHILIRKTPIVI